MYMLAISPQTRSGRFSNSSGPGCSPYMMNAASSTAVEPEPGTPSVSSGTIAPPVEALFAASGPATPSIMPVPNFALSRESMRSTL